MSTAISVDNSNPKHINKHFVRCKYFFIVDPTLKTQTKLANPYFKDKEDAGINAIKYLNAHGVRKIVAGDFGAHVQDEAHKHQIQLIIVDTNKINISNIKY